MNKVFIEGWIYNLHSKELPYNVDEATFRIKTKKIVRKKESDKPEYDYIPCYVRGKRATNIIKNIGNDARVYIWGRMYFDENEKMTIAVDEIQFL